MTDERTRDLERAWRESGDPAARAAWFAATTRAGQPWSFGRHVTRTPEVYRALEAAEKASGHLRPLIIVGPANSGRTTLARAIHLASARAARPFVEVDLRALSPLLSEVELFGAMVGAFTGEGRDEPGAIERAAGGTLLVTLDHIDPLGEEIERGLRRALVEGESKRVGGLKVFPVDLRFVFEVVDPTHITQPLLDSLEGTGALTIDWPSLTRRSADLPLILGELGTEGLEVEEEFLELCRGHDWPGELRELSLLIQRARFPEIPITGLPPQAFETRALSLLMGLETREPTQDTPRANSRGALGGQ